MSQEIITYLLGAVVLIALGVIYFCNKQQGNPKMQTLSLVMLVVAVAAGGFLIWNMIFGNTADQDRIKSSDVLYASQGFKFGKMISEANAGSNVLVLMEENAADRAENVKDSREAMFIEAMKQADPGLNVSIVVPQAKMAADLPEGMRQSLTFGKIVTADDFNKAIDGKNATAIVFACQLPQSFTVVDNGYGSGVLPDSFKCFKKNAAEKLPVYMTDLSISPKYAAEMLAQKRIAGAVARNSGEKGEVSPDNYEAAFNVGWKLVEPAASRR
ncbi:MAG: hypothetical protein AB7F40_11030 [Victivallaceae bacterium]|nr:hypothetical protein [Victivallaceae bacterium]